MARDFFTMDDFDLSGRTVLLRVDINSPIDPGTGALLNDARIRAPDDDPRAATFESRPPRASVPTGKR